MKTTHTHRECRHCEGSGEIIINNTNPHGYGRDPQCDEARPCSVCRGRGYVMTVPADPILQLPKWRRAYLRSRYGGAAIQYGALRQAVVSPVVLP